MLSLEIQRWKWKKKKKRDRNADELSKVSHRDGKKKDNAHKNRRLQRETLVDVETGSG